MALGRTAVVFAAMIVLAALDFAGALFAKNYADRHRPVALVLGIVVFIALFLIYARSLEIAQLSIVTMGWIVLLQVGLLIVDWRSHGLRLDHRQWAAVAAIIALQCYLVFSADSAAGQK